MAPLSGRLPIHAFELPTELRGASITHIHRCLVYGLSIGNLHRCIVQAHGFHELDWRHCRCLSETTVEDGAAHSDLRGHFVDGDGLVQPGGEVVDEVIGEAVERDAGEGDGFDPVEGEGTGFEVAFDKGDGSAGLARNGPNEPGSCWSWRPWDNSQCN